MPDEKKRFERIILHSSDSNWGCNMIIQDWHRARGFRTTGYHAIILNSYPTSSHWKNKKSVPHFNGAVEVGRPINDDFWFDSIEQGAHVKGHNTGSFGICMIGEKVFSDVVLNKALDVVSFYLKQFKLDMGPNTVYGHYELDQRKTCPNIDMDIFRGHLFNGTLYDTRPVIKPKPFMLESVEEEKISIGFFSTLLKKLLQGLQK